MNANDQADANIIVDKDAGWTEQESAILNQLDGLLSTNQLDAVICVAGRLLRCESGNLKWNKKTFAMILFSIWLGGWAGGNASKDLGKNSELMWKQSVWSSTISAAISSRFLKPGGVLTLTGADAALKASTI